MSKEKKKGTAPPRYDEAFKAGAVRMVTEQGRPGGEVAKELGICVDTLRSWLKVSGVQMGQADRQNREARRIRELEAGNRALRRQLGEKDEVKVPGHGVGQPVSHAEAYISLFAEPRTPADEGAEYPL